MKITEVAVPTIFINGQTPRAFQTDTGCNILVSNEQGKDHLSISHHSRYPNWDEIHDVRDLLLSDNKTFALILPPKKEYVNLHPNCFHLWEI